MRTVLAMDILRQGRPEVLTPEADLGRPVRWMHSGEVANMATFLHGNELVVTTGMGIGGLERDQRRFVDQLADRGVAGLVIELGTTFLEPPTALVEQARRRDMPLVVLHREVSFVEITEAVHREIVNRQFVVMRRGEEIHRRFTELMLGGSGIPEVLSALSETISNPVVLEKAGHGIIYHACHWSESTQVMAAWAQVADGSAQRHDAVLVPVPMGGNDVWGYLGAMPLDSPLDEFDRVALERAVELIALSLLRSRQEDVLTVRERGNFLARIVDSHIDDEAAAAYGTTVGFPATPGLLLPLAVMRSAESPDRKETEEASWALIARDIRRELETLRIPVIIGRRSLEHDTLMVVMLDSVGRRAAIADRVAALLAVAAERHLGLANACVLAVGPAVAGWSELRGGLREALDAALAAIHAPPQPWYDSTRPDLHWLFFHLQGAYGLRVFTEQRLGQLLEHDRRRKAKLLPTLWAYCEHGGRKAETARVLHVERQSLYYRIQRIERLLGASLADPDTLLGVHIALRARQHMALTGSPGSRDA